jgi:tight adherence protein B
MWLVPLTFALSVVIIFGLYWALVARPEGASRDAVTKRLRKQKATGPRRQGLLASEKTFSSIPALDAIIARAGGVVAPIQELLDTADVSMTVGRFLLSSVLLAAVVYLLVAVFLRMTGVALVAALLASAIPYMVIRRKATVRIRKFEEQFPEAVDLIARAMRAGHGLTAGLGMVADELPVPVGREFRLLYDWQNFGMALPDALQRFGQRIPLMDARFFVTAVLTQRESGGNLAEVLDNLSKVIRDRFRVKRQIRVISAHGRMTGAVLGGLPPCLAIYFFAVKPDYIQTMTTDPLGIRMIFTAIAMQIIGVLIIKKLVNIEY